MKLQKNQVLTLEIVDLNHLGFGVGKADGCAVFVAGTVTGDVAEVKLIKVNASYAVGRCEKLLTSSPLRVSDRCGNKGCGGCAYREIAYEEEKKIKRQNVISAFKKAGLSVTTAPLLSTEKTKHYRNKAQYPVAQDRDGRIRIGFYAPKSHRVCEAADCPLQPAAFQPLLETIRSFLEEYHISAYDEQTGKGLIRHIYLRRGEVSGQILLTIVCNSDKIPCENDLVSRISATDPNVVGVLLNINKKDTNVILGDEYRVLYGVPSLTDTLCGVSLSLAAPAFYQVNHDAAELLYRKARELAAPTGTETLLDLFCGIGSIGLSMADAVKELIGVEIVPEAVACAKENAAKNGVSNAHFYVGDATDTEQLLARAETERGAPVHADVVVLDPPRAGCDEKLLRFVASRAPSRIVYVSCNPETLARDAAVLTRLGYACGEVTPVDLFPGTGHVETVVLLSRV